jgi:hypothetical protein
MIFGTRNVRSLYEVGSLMTIMLRWILERQDGGGMDWIDLA